MPIVVLYNYFRKEANSVRIEKEHELTAIANLKASQIKQWIKERNGDANLFKYSPLFTKDVRELINKPYDVVQREKMIKRIGLTKKYYDYENIIVTDEKGNKILSAEPMSAKLSKSTVNKIDQAVRVKDIYISDFYYCEDCRRIHLDFIAPLTDENNNVYATVLMRVDPNTYLYPLIKSWPIPSKTSETLLAQKEGDSIVFCNDLRFRQDAAMKLKFSVNNDEIMAVRAAKGQTGIFNGKDYRGDDVIADLRKLDGTRWFMVTKIDKDELFAEINYRKNVAIALIVFVLAIIAILTFTVYNLFRRKTYEKLYLKEKELNKLDKEFRTTLYSIGDAVLITDNAGRITNINPMAEVMTGWKEEEGIGKPVEDVFNIVNEYSRKTVENPVKRVLREGVIVGLANHTLLLSKDGRETPIADSGAPVRNKDGEITGVVLVCRDQAEERTIIRNLADSKMRFQKLFASINDGLCLHELVFDLDGKPCDYRILEVNDRYTELTGIPKEKAIGILASKLYGIKEPPYFDVYSEVALSGKSVTFEAYFEPLKKHFQISVFSPEHKQFATAFQDITISKEAENKLKESEKHFRSLIEHSQDAITLLSHDGTVLYDSPSVLQVLGYSTTERLGRKVFEFVIPEQRETMALGFAKFAEQNAATAVSEISFIRKDGSECLIEGVRTNLLHEPFVEAIVVNYHDITERKLTEIELINAKEKAEESDRLKTSFLQNISHEVRTPMNSIMGFANLLTDDGVEEKEKKEYFDIIKASCNQLLNIVSDIINISLIESGQTKVTEAETDVKIMINNLYQQHKNTIATDKIKFSLKFEEGIKFRNILTDETKLSQVLSNLIRNAIKFTKEGSIEVGCKLKDSEIEFYVKDTGIGIAIDKQFYIFERFWQEDSQANRKFQGMGLGLSISKAYVEMMGGKMWLKSKKGEGSVFYFTIPNKSNLSVEEKKPKIKVDILMQPKHAKTILVVEDEMYNFILIKAIFAKNNFKILHALDGLEGVNLCKQDPDIDIVLMDIRLPVMDGFEATELIKKMRPELPIIVITAYAMKSDEERIMKCGCNAYLTKPLSSSKLFEVMNNYVKN